MSRSNTAIWWNLISIATSCSQHLTRCTHLSHNYKEMFFLKQISHHVSKENFTLKWNNDSFLFSYTASQPQQELERFKSVGVMGLHDSSKKSKAMSLREKKNPRPFSMTIPRPWCEQFHGETIFFLPNFTTSQCKEARACDMAEFWWTACWAVTCLARPFVLLLHMSK